MRKLRNHFLFPKGPFLAHNLLKNCQEPRISRLESHSLPFNVWDFQKRLKNTQDLSLGSTAQGRDKGS
jgi:hypothetical protein